MNGATGLLGRTIGVGGVGFFTYLSSSLTNAPVVVMLDDLAADQMP